MTPPVSDESNATPMTAFAPSAFACSLSRSSASSRDWLRSWVYSWISPPASERRPAVMLRPRPRLRTIRPHVNPTVFVILWPGRYGVLTTMTSSLNWFHRYGIGRDMSKGHPCAKKNSGENIFSTLLKSCTGYVNTSSEEQNFLLNSKEFHENTLAI